MRKIKLILCCLALTGLFACSPKPTVEPEQTVQIGYLKTIITQTELNNRENFKRYHYVCQHLQTKEIFYLATYFPLWRESRLPENLGFYFQLNNGKAHPFDHLESKPLNKAATRFEVRYRSYLPIDGSYIVLKAREKSSIYYKNNQPWLECREG